MHNICTWIGFYVINLPGVTETPNVRHEGETSGLPLWRHKFHPGGASLVKIKKHVYWRHNIGAT